MSQPASNHSPVRRSAWIVWAACAAISLFTLSNLGKIFTSQPPGGSSIKLSSDVAWTIFPIVFAIVAALIISRQPNNRIGWLLLVPTMLFAVIGPMNATLAKITTPPAPSLTLLVVVWFQNWSWVLLIIPLLLILLLFPTGKPPSPRWRWVQWYALGLILVFMFLATFQEYLQPTDYDWKLVNPIGWIPENPKYFNTVILVWLLNLGILTIFCAASLIVRFRGAAAVERQQIKWLMYAGGLFVVFYVPLLFWQGGQEGLASDLTNLGLILFITSFPIAIAIAILRYRLWDIDVLIRRTLLYAAVSVTLGGIYSGSVVLLQSLFQSITGQQSPAAVVVSTLIIAALFTPLRRRIQQDIDRRFYRKKYDAEKALETFATKMRDEMELDQLSAHLMAVVRETMQPEQVSLWLREPGRLIKQ